MLYSLEEFLDDEKVKPLQVMEICSNPDMYKWPLKKKLRYLTERKEILYGIWSLENGGHKFSKNFYRAFANEAKLLLTLNHDNMQRLIEFQNQILDEITIIRDNPEMLYAAYEKHEKQLTLIRYHKDEYIKQRILDYKNLLKATNSKAKSYGVILSLRSEIRLLYQRGYVDNWETINNYMAVIFDKPKTPPQSDLSPKIVDKRPNVSSTKRQPNNMKSTIRDINHSKAEKKFLTYSEKNSFSQEKNAYHQKFMELDDKIYFWICLYKDPGIVYFRDYQRFRDAINTEIDVSELSGEMPPELYQIARNLVDFKFEKVEFIKNFLEFREDDEVTKVKENANAYLANYWQEILSNIEGKQISPEFAKRINEMFKLKANLLTKEVGSELVFGGKKYGRCN